jgi:hypothetical protein
MDGGMSQEFKIAIERKMAIPSLQNLFVVVRLR